jgi:hypothetical protein
MINIYEFLYYSLYRVFKLVKRVGEKDENLASSFFSILLSTNTGMILFVLRYIVPKDLFLQHPSYNIFIKLMYVSILVIWYLICKNYFLKKENYLRIVSFYESKYEGRNNQMVIIGVLYSLITFSSFIGLAMWLSRI